jgi:diacylglycerol kinase (ATP)
MPRALLLINRNSRRGAEIRHEAHDHLRSLGFDVTEAWPQSPATTVEFLHRHCAGMDCVVVGGGDGTLVSMIGGLLDLRIPLGIIPIGTFNDLARTLGIPLDVRKACEVVAAGHTRSIDAGSVNGKYFVNEASIGISTRIARAQTTDVKRKLGMLAVAATTLRAIRYSRPFHATVDHTGGRDRVRTIQLTVANSYHFGAWITNRDAALDDGKLDLYALEVCHWREVFPLLGAVMRQQLQGCAGIRTIRDVRFTIRTARPRAVFTDGEPATFTPATFAIHPGALTVFAPAEGAA